MYDSGNSANAGQHGRRGGSSSSKREEVWPVRDVSFEVQSGDVVGIIGRNGAGKSTLLKLLSRITEPTSGRAQMFGRVGTLLEVGTGLPPRIDWAGQHLPQWHHSWNEKNRDLQEVR